MNTLWVGGVKGVGDHQMSQKNYKSVINSDNIRTKPNFDPHRSGRGKRSKKQKMRPREKQ